MASDATSLAVSWPSLVVTCTICLVCRVACPESSDCKGRRASGMATWCDYGPVCVSISSLAISVSFRAL